MNGADVEVSVFQDGENDAVGRAAIEAAFQRTWRNHYAGAAALQIRPGCINLKRQPEAAAALDCLSKIYAVRNPDIYFVARRGDVVAELGGIEITTHSPDGSNVDKRYPFIWAAGQWPVNAFVATPYMKQRPNGQQNCLPHRHAARNQRFADEWNPDDPEHSNLRQILPIRELQIGAGRRLPANVADSLFSWADLGAFFAHVAARRLLGPVQHALALRELRDIKRRLQLLVAASLANTTDTDPSSLIVQPHRWVQVYNTRPETGHWERGEGQFDSIDGRIMFTADELAELPEQERPSLEFWLPQMASAHPWIAEQRQRDYGSKRLRNLLVVLAPFCVTRFADQLDPADWTLLQQNRQVLLERLDWPPGLYQVRRLVGRGSVSEIARRGLNGIDRALLRQIEDHLQDEDLYYASFRPYGENWQESLTQAARSLSPESRVLLPRIPRSLAKPVARGLPCAIFPAESCTRSELMTIRQLDRNRHEAPRRGRAAAAAGR